MVHLGQPGGVGVVDQRDGTAQVVLEELRRLKPRPGLVEVRDERHPPMHDRRGDGQPDAGPVGDLVLEILDDLRDHRGHILGAGLRRGGDAQPGLGEVSQFQVDRSALDARTTNVNAQDIHGASLEAPQPGRARDGSQWDAVANAAADLARMGPS